MLLIWRLTTCVFRTRSPWYTTVSNLISAQVLVSNLVLNHLLIIFIEAGTSPYPCARSTLSKEKKTNSGRLSFFFVATVVAYNQI
jgi:hypothetical protein